MNVRYQSESINIKMKFLTYYEQNAIYFSVVTSMDFLSYPFTNTLTRHCLYPAFNNPYSYVVTSLPYLRLVCILFLCHRNQLSARYCSVYVNSASNSFNQSFVFYSPIIYLSATYTLSLISLYSSVILITVSVFVHTKPETVAPVLTRSLLSLTMSPYSFIPSQKLQSPRSAARLCFSMQSRLPSQITRLLWL